MDPKHLNPAPDHYLKINPLSLVPAITLEGQEPIVDSSVILDFLDDHTGGVWPKELNERWQVRRASALANGIITDAVGWLLETRRAEPNKDAMQLRVNTIHRTLKPLAEMCRRKQHWWRKPNQAMLDVGVALDYLCFRIPDVDWLIEENGFGDEVLEVLDEIPAFAETLPPGLERSF